MRVTISKHQISGLTPKSDLDQEITREVEVCEQLITHRQPKIAVYVDCLITSGRAKGIGYVQYKSTLLVEETIEKVRQDILEVLDGVLSGKGAVSESKMSTSPLESQNHVRHLLIVPAESTIVGAIHTTKISTGYVLPRSFMIFPLLLIDCVQTSGDGLPTADLLKL